MQKEVRKAMQKAKELEKIPFPTKEEIVAIYKDGLEQAEKLRKLLKPEWFMLDEKEIKKTKKKTTAKRKRKKRVSRTKRS